MSNRDRTCQRVRSPKGHCPYGQKPKACIVVPSDSPPRARCASMVKPFVLSVTTQPLLRLISACALPVTFTLRLFSRSGGFAIHRIRKGDLQSPSSLLHHFVYISFPVFQGDAHRVCACGQLVYVDALKGIVLLVHQSPFQVVKLHLGGLHVGGEF